MALLPDVLRAAGSPEAAAALRSDPLLNHNFIVSLLDSTSALAPAAPPPLAAILASAAGGFAECRPPVIRSQLSVRSTDCQSLQCLSKLRPSSVACSRQPLPLRVTA